LLLFAWPSQEKQKNEYTLSIPKLASLINTHDLNGEMLGLKSVAPTEQPRVAPVFFSFRVMVGIGVLMLLTAFAGLYLRAKGRLYSNKGFHRLCIAIAPLGFVASISGWLTAEIGRQPWVVYHLLKTQNAVSAIEMDVVIISFILLVLAYGVIFGFYLYYLFQLIRVGPKSADANEVEYHSFQYMTDIPREKN